MDNELKWSITRTEKQQLVQKALLILAPFAISIIYSALTQLGYSFKNTIILIIGLALSFLMLLLINRFFPYKERTYSFNDNGLIISKGKKMKRYLWSDFECFYTYYINYGKRPDKTDRSSSFDIYRSDVVHPDIDDENKKRFEEYHNIEESIIYLKKKQKNIFTKLYKSFVVVYSEVDNTSAVLDFLDSHLPQKTMSTKTELGLILYEFK